VRGILTLRLTALEFPREYATLFPGPRLGVEGFRKHNNVYGRPVLMGPLRPEVGFSPEQYADVAYQAYLGGADMVKDDELLVDPRYCPIKRRARACADAARRAEDHTGLRKTFFLNIGTDLTRFAERMEVGHQAGVDGFMVHPRMTPSLLTYARSLTALPIIAHYEFVTVCTKPVGAGIDFPVMGQLYRAAGADIITMPRPNPRFDISSHEYVRNLRACFEPLGNTAAACPAPTGGNTPADVYEVYELIRRPDYVFVSGSAMFEDRDGITAGSKKLRDAIAGLERHLSGATKPEARRA